MNPRPLLLLLCTLPSLLAIVCFTDIACLMLSHGEFACNNTALVDCTESTACLSYYSSPDLTPSPTTWSTSHWTRRLRGCASDDVVTSLFDTATGWSARCGFGGERIIEEKMTTMRDNSNTTETATIPILASNDSTLVSSITNDSLAYDNSSFPFPPPLTINTLNDTTNDSNTTTPRENTTLPLDAELQLLLTNETIDNITTITTESIALSTITQPSTTTDPDATTETIESSTTSETDPGVAIETNTESSRRVRRDPMVPAGYAGCLCYSDGCNGPHDKYESEIRQWLENRAVEAEGRGEGVEVKTTDYEDTGAEPVSESV